MLIDGKPFTQLENLNVKDELRIKGELATSGNFSYSFPYQNPTPVQTADQDTGVRADDLPPNSIVFLTVLFTVDANQNQYAIAISTDNQLSQMLTDLRQLRSAEPVSGGGDVAVSSWLDSVTETYHYSLDVDGGGKTLDSVSVVVRSIV